jgi:glycosyltransferase involved in cell wall biosynthesis
MTAKPTFAFVIPCFNEQDNVAATVGSVREAMGRRENYEIILVNDASTDHTLERMQPWRRPIRISAFRQSSQSRLRRLLQAGRPGGNRNLCQDAHLLMEVGVVLPAATATNAITTMRNTLRIPTQRPLWLGCTTKSAATVGRIQSR